MGIHVAGEVTDDQALARLDDETRRARRRADFGGITIDGELDLVHFANAYPDHLVRAARGE